MTQVTTTVAAFGNIGGQLQFVVERDDVTGWMTPHHVIQTAGFPVTQQNPLPVAIASGSGVPIVAVNPIEVVTDPAFPLSVTDNAAINLLSAILADADEDKASSDRLASYAATLVAVLGSAQDPLTGRLRMVVDAITGNLLLGKVNTIGGFGGAGTGIQPFISDASYVPVDLTAQAWALGVRQRIT